MYHVHSLKHLCRRRIRVCFNYQIMNKIDRCSQLNAKQRDYLTLNEISLIYSKITHLSAIQFLIDRLVRDLIIIRNPHSFSIHF
jgi:hypothetical protein